ncbi:MAG: exopolysaccharide biosynthesis polyprenyl glycosylphosphotransferase, partial [Candidatus Buchananbacteria bacterium]
KTLDLINFADEYHIDFKYAADLLGTHLLNLDVATFAGMPIIEVKRTRLDGWGRISKRFFDLFGSIILLILLSPLMLITAMAIKMNSAGPVFFKYKRIGQNGKPFVYFKFRSMVKDAHQLRFDPQFLAQQQNVRQGTPMLKFKNDPRITRVGKFIRRFSIDELPELFLVFAGKMSLVGPRPHEVEEVSKYQHHHKKVLTIKPGMTGLAQVSGRSDLNFEEEVKLDIYYIENWSLGLDIQILFKTPMAVIKRRQTT